MRSSPSALADPRHAWLTAQPYAHRGLHGPGTPENSRAAFTAAIAAGHGIELDVRLSRDGIAVVFHDADLNRMTAASGRLAARDAADLGKLSLAGTSDRIETLASVLAFIADRAPVLIELKIDGDARAVAPLCLSVRHAIEGRGGSLAVMSFDPRVGAWYARRAPATPRGLVIGSGSRGLLGKLRRLLSFWVARPHFLAHDVNALPSRLAAHARRRGKPILAWTVRSDRDRATATAHADAIIFEG